MTRDQIIEARQALVTRLPMTGELLRGSLTSSNSANYSPRGPKVGPIPTMLRSHRRTRSRSWATYGCSAAIDYFAATAQWRPTLSACSVATDVERVLGGVAPHLMVTDPPYGAELAAAGGGIDSRQIPCAA
jgi:hypothetical protein